MRYWHIGVGISYCCHHRAFSCLSLLNLENCGSRLTSSTIIPSPRFIEMVSPSLRSEDLILARSPRISYIVKATSEVVEWRFKTLMILRVHGKMLKWLGLLDCLLACLLWSVHHSGTMLLAILVALLHSGTGTSTFSTYLNA